ncbi:MAG: DUF5681 domain-containing protein [Desulfovibrionaceae bacterium]|nr:DUF5681 domain-containing protein [Desulfovibrionaceae bacterium]
MSPFKRGQSGNPTGRPKGSINRQLAALREAADKVLPLVVEKALAGDADAQKLILDRALPRAKPMSPAEPFTLPEGDLLNQVQAVLRQVADGELSPTAAAEVVGMVATAAKVEEIDSLRAELSSLKRVLEGRKKK